MFANGPVKTIAAQAARNMSASAKVWINKDTKVICQGFTGKQVRSALACLDVGRAGSGA
jgi:hypothetical protein